MHYQACSQGLFKNRVLFVEQLFADLSLVELRIQLVDFGLVLFANRQVFFQALAQLVARAKAGERRVKPFLRLLQLRRLVLLERGQLGCFVGRLFACGDFLFESYVALELRAQQIFRS
ncbi:hypothetical protein D3C76_989380 [compost metagenome]